MTADDGPSGHTDERFPGFDVIKQAHSWDDVTRAVVMSRLTRPGPLQFFSRSEEPTARALVDRLLDLDGDGYVPVLSMIDERLHRRQGDGYRYRDMPEDPVAWRRSIGALDTDAQSAAGCAFWELPLGLQMGALEQVRQAEGQWYDMPASRVFSLWLRYCCDAFYAHPSAWNEIGFGGPAYPRGYKNLGLDRLEHWEVREHHARDPIPWVRRTEEARRRHTGAMPQSGGQPVPSSLLSVRSEDGPRDGKEASAADHRGKTGAEAVERSS